MAEKKEKAAPEEVKETLEEAAEAKEEVKEAAPAEEKKAEKKAEKKEKPAKKGAGKMPVIIAAAGVLVVALVVVLLAVISGSGAVSAFNEGAAALKNKAEYQESFTAAYSKSKLALFMPKAQKNQIAEQYILRVLCENNDFYTASKIMKKMDDEQKAKLFKAEGSLALCFEGEIATFGKYNTDNDPKNGAEDLEWIVLDVVEDKNTGRARAFIMTKEVINSPKGWNKFESNGSFYKDSNLYDWCEKDFYPTFKMQDSSLEERILYMNVETEDASDGSDSGEAVPAHAYAPSKQEIETYLTGDLAQFIAAEATATAKGAGVKPATYFLRNCGIKEDGIQRAAGVNKDGEILEGMSMANTQTGVRVCINVDLGEF